MEFKPSKLNRIAIIDDDQDILDLLNQYLNLKGFRVDSYSSLQEFQDSKITDHSVIICDVLLPEKSGVELIGWANQRKIPIIMMTAKQEVSLAVDSLKAGAFDFLLKPFQLEQLEVNIRNAINQKSLSEENLELRKKVDQKAKIKGLVGKSPAIENLSSLVERVANYSSNVIILGESGTGKEMVARGIHDNGRGLNKYPFVPINCSAIPESLFESELFGYEKGSFTGADEARKGLIESAHNGTLFLDEIGDLPLSMQAKLLRVLQEKKFKRIGSNVEQPIDIRVIAATHKNLKQLVQLSKFREDLYYRLNVISVEVPPLRQRKEDIPELINFFTEKVNRQHQTRVSSISKDALNAFVDYSWPGNVRELENAVEQIVVLAESETITISDIPKHLLSSPENQQDSTEQNVHVNFESESKPLKKQTQFVRQFETLKEAEKNHILKVLKHHNGNKKIAAKTLGVNWRTLYRKLQGPSSEQSLH